ncbi:MAG TPA: helix-turn-helix domain-containing protein [Thiobacillaceae bacterium]|nr:helix-turn-helix domain-containing protein [Thiobacillaceae bacterium]
MASNTSKRRSSANRPRDLPRYYGTYRAADLAILLGVSRNTIWRWNAEGRIPKGKALSPGVTIWDGAEIDAWLNGPQVA